MSSRLRWSKKVSVEHMRRIPEEEAEWDGFIGVVWVARCFEEVLMVFLWALYGDLFRCGC